MLFIISPHIDDAVLSLGGLIQDLTMKNEKVSILYVFTISQWTNPNAISGKKYDKDTISVTEIRKEEESAIAKRLAYDFDFMDFHDLPLRFTGNSSSEVAMISEIINTIKKRITRDDQVFFPLGLDHHDHIIIHKIGLDLIDEGYQILFYEDLPYAAMGKHDHQKNYTNLIQKDFEPISIPIDIDVKIDLLKHYGSQMSQTWLNHISTYAYSLHDNKFYERFWKPAGMTLKF